MQVFTHPDKSEENGHIESFHKTVVNAIKDDQFTLLAEAEKRLDTLYERYNSFRHNTTTKIPPSKFWLLYDAGLVDVVISEKERKSHYKLKVAYQETTKIPNIKKYENWVVRA